MNIGIVSLGCAKNQVDLEEILAYLKINGMETVSDPELADIILVNTCGFIESAKTESIRAILDMCAYGKPVVVTGCLATRYLEELREEIPEVSLFIPIEEYKNFGKHFEKLLEDKKMNGEIDPRKRLYISPEREAYLRISDGCNNCCNFCAIPLIRHSFKSVPLQILKDELDILEKDGIKALTVISQDTSMYGKDIGSSLVELTEEIVKHKGFDFVKLMYLYPDEVEDELIDLYASNQNITPYFDLPVQHLSDHVLKLMGRRGSKQDILTLIKKFREKVPDAIIRTTIMVGFPGETEEDFNELIETMKEVKFDHLGCFMFCPEEGTRAFKFKDQVPEEIKKKRYKEVMKLQKKISYKLNQERIGKSYQCLVTGIGDDGISYKCINNLYAPDDIDGEMILYSKFPLTPGDLVSAKIVSASFYDVIAETTEILRPYQK